MITLCVPTRGRAIRFKTMLESAERTATGPIEIVAVRDADDEQNYPDLPLVRYVRVVRPLNGDHVQMSGLWTKAFKHGRGDIAMLCADDVVFETPGWDARVFDAFDSFGDGIGMVYAHAGMEDRPVLPFVSRKWIETVGYFTPPDWPGWMVDEWIWSIAAELKRVVFLDDVVIRHEQTGVDPTYADGQRSRAAAGGLRGMRKRFYTFTKTLERDAAAKKLRAQMRGDLELMPEPQPQWVTDCLAGNLAARKHHRLQTQKTLVSLHCYEGDLELIKRHMPLYKHHGAPLVILSPEDSPVVIKGEECHSMGGRGYFGQVSLDRQVLHMQYLLSTPYDFFLMNDADSFCLSAEIPRYVYEGAERGIIFSNQVVEWRPHPSPYPKMAMQPPYFMHRSSMERLVSVAHLPQVKAHPITPFIDWFMVALSHESQTSHDGYPDGVSFPAWRWNREDIPDTVELGNDFVHKDNPDGTIRGDLLVEEAADRGAVFIHSVKHKYVMDLLIAAHARYLRRGSPQPNTLTIEEYVHKREREQPRETFVVEMGRPFTEGDSVRI